MNVLDIIFIIILALAALNGFRAGLVVSISRLVGMAVGFGVALFYCRPASIYLEGHFNLADKLGPYISSMISIPLHVSGENISGFVERSLASVSGLLASNECAFVQRLIELLQISSVTLEQSLGNIITLTILDIVVFLIILFAVARLVVMIGFFVSRAFSCTFVGIFDRMGGGFFGIARGIIIITVLIAVLIPLQAFGSLITGGGNEGVLFNLLDNSQVVSYLGCVAEYLSSYLLQNAPPANII